MLYSNMTRALLSRWSLILTVFVAVVAMSVAWLLSVERTYVARASLLFDDRGPNPALQDNQPVQNEKALLGTQADLIKSEAVARGVIQSENFGNDAALRRKWQALGERGGSFEAWLATDLLSNLKVSPERDTNVLAVRYTASDPQLAARLANSFARNFVAVRMQISTNTAKQYARWFQQQTDSVRGNLERAQAAVTSFQRSHGMVGGDALALEADRLSALSGQLASAEGAAADMRARAGNRVSESPDVQSTGVVQTLRQQLAAREATLSELASTHGDAHPEMVAARAERDTIRAKLNSETGAASQTVRVASSAASSREAQLQRLVNSQRSRMLGVTANQAQLEALQNEVTTAQKAYDAVTQRLNLMRLQSGLPTTNAQQVDRATAPLLPASPNVPLLLLLAAVGGLALGLIAAIALELRRPLVRTVGGLFASTGVPVLGTFDFKTLPQLRELKAGGI